MNKPKTIMVECDTFTKLGGRITEIVIDGLRYVPAVLDPLYEAASQHVERSVTRANQQTINTHSESYKGEEMWRCNCPHETRSGCSEQRCTHYVRPRIF